MRDIEHSTREILRETFIDRITKPAIGEYGVVPKEGIGKQFWCQIKKNCIRSFTRKTFLLKEQELNKIFDYKI